MNHILCATDGSEYAFRAIEFASKLAVAMETRLTIVAVRLYIGGPSSVTDVWTHEEARDYLSKASEIVRGQGFAQAVLVLLRSRDVAYAIIEYAEKHDVDHIVVGSRGAGGIKRFETGSVSDEVIRKSYCPVTIVP